MINREATKIDLVLDEELNEYEEMKTFRLNKPKEFEELFNINEINNQFPLFQDFQFSLNQFNDNENSCNRDSSEKNILLKNLILIILIILIIKTILVIIILILFLKLLI